MDGLSRMRRPDPGLMARPRPVTFDLTGRVALVTGARRGIGRAIAEAFAAQGATVVVHHSGSEEECADADDTIRVIAASGGTAQAIAADFLAPGSGEVLADTALGIFGRLDILVLNASIEIEENLGDIGAESLRRQVQVNLAEPLALLQRSVPGMLQRQWGRVLAIGSTQQCRPSPRKLVYGATKAAQMNWVLNLARQLGPHGVTANNIAPGVIATARNAEQIRADGPHLLRGIPTGRLGRPEDLVGAALLLCSDAGSYINGTNIWVDGGRHAG